MAAEREPALAAELAPRADDQIAFRAARLLLLFSVLAASTLKRPLDIERLAYYDFFSASPFLLFETETNAGKTIQRAGFSSYDLSYQSSGHRWVTRRSRLQNDLAYLLSRGLVEATTNDRRVVYRATPAGLELGDQLESLYADAYRESARLVIERLDRSSDSVLAQDARRRLTDDQKLLDLYTLEDDSPLRANA
jgi:hypothetical protein